MRVPQLNERVKEAPASALRAMFAGIGSLLSVTDKIRPMPAAETAPETKAAAPETAAPESSASPAPSESNSGKAASNKSVAGIAIADVHALSYRTRLNPSTPHASIAPHAVARIAPR